MKKNDLLKFENQIVRILSIKEDKVFVIDCVKKTVPRWKSADEFPILRTYLRQMVRMPILKSMV